MIAAMLLICFNVTGCNSAPQRSSPIGVAYAGPATLSLHADVDLKSATVATVHHGDKLEIVGRRRSSWYKVRTAAGAEGWTSDRELLDATQMKRLQKLAAETSNLPSQGTASSFSALNVHTEPNRQSASFVQVLEKEKFEVLAHRVAERTPPPKRQLVPPAPKVAKKASKKQGGKVDKDETTEVVPPPPPPPAAPGPPPATDDWTLIRTQNGQTGWVLTNAVYLEIPDEVAQYAEGHRITSYFSIGKMKDQGEEKDIWLWTTSEKLGEDHDFDSYRVFTWSLRKHRYETAYIQRRETGFFPVIAKPGEFSVCLEKKDGSRVRKRYTLLNNSVRPAGDSPCDVMPVQRDQDEATSAQHLTDVPSIPEVPGLRERITATLNRLRGKH
jgi:uncharacterized protein YgiM (DUF1202 family)